MDKTNAWSLIISNYFEPVITCEIRFNQAKNENELYIIDANRYFSNITGVPASESIGKKFSEVCPDSNTSIFDWPKLLIDSALTNEYKIIEQYFDSFNKFLKLFIFGYDEGIFYVIMQDVTYRKQQMRVMLEKNKQIEYLLEDMRSKNDKDSLTDLYNYQFAMESIECSIEDYVLNGTGFSILLIDMLHFRSVNEMHGFKAADRLLIKISESIKSNTRKIDVACRYGGDKFLIIYNNIDADIARVLIDRLKKTIKKDIIMYEGKEIFFNGSLIDYSGQNRRQLIMQLEENVKRAKSLGPDVIL